MNMRRDFSPKVKMAAFARADSFVCDASGCNRMARGNAESAHLCSMHYQRWKKFGSVLLPDRRKSPDGRCASPGCEKPIRSANANYCNTHYHRVLRGSQDGLLPVRKNCLRCGSGLIRNQSKFCSARCRWQFARGTLEKKSCVICETLFVHPGTNAVCCSRECRNKLEYQWGRKTRARERWKEGARQREYTRKSRKAAAPFEKFSREEIFERDGWRCQLCGKMVARKAKWPAPFFATLDHIIPLAKGGSHTRLNVQCAHLTCNIRKNDRAGGQLRLFG